MMSKKQIAIVVVLFLLFTLTVAVIIVKKRNVPPKTVDTASQSFLLYKNLDPKFKDCGSEELEGGYGYTEKMRDCFIKAYETCSYAKMYQKLVTLEKDSIFTVVTIEGKASRGCSAHVYIDSFDINGDRRQYDTKCYSVVSNTSSGQKSIFFDRCANGTQHFFY